EPGATSSLLADVGATNTRFALLVGDKLSPITVVRTGAFAAPDTAIAEFLDRVKAPVPPGRAVIAAAGPPSDGVIELTNSNWTLDARALARRFDFARVELVNDFAALASAIPALGPADLRPIGGATAQPGKPAVVIGPGTGLGVAALMPAVGGDRVVAGEGGHVTLPATDAEEDAVIARLRERFGHVSAERVLCGPGLRTLYEALGAIEGIGTPYETPAEIAEAAISGSDRLSHTALQLFCAFLGTVAGDLALTFGARGGVYIGGGIAPRIVDFLAQSAFRQRFEAKGRFGRQLSQIATLVIMHEEPAFLGLARLAARL
ncbi:MAG: glucokinase, partial [Kiloniellales bacterium]